MMVRPYYYFDLGCAAYLCGCGTAGKGAVVDTRVHADHRSGYPELPLDREGFVEALSDVPPKPAEMDRVLAFNRGRQEAKARHT